MVLLLSFGCCYRRRRRLRRCRHPGADACTRARAHAGTRTHARALARVCTHACTLACACTRARTHARTRARRHACMHARTQIIAFVLYFGYIAVRNAKGAVYSAADPCAYATQETRMAGSRARKSKVKFGSIGLGNRYATILARVRVQNQCDTIIAGVRVQNQCEDDS